MSGCPYPAGVADVVALVDRAASLHSEIEQLRPKARRLQDATEDLAECQRKLIELLRVMDVESPGNAGHYERLTWFLAEMRRKVANDVRDMR